MNDIVRPLTEDKQIGFDCFDQLLLKTKRGDYTVTRMTPDLRGQSCAICGKPWSLSAESWSDHFYWRPYKEHVHTTCIVKYYTMKDRDAFFQHFVAARVAFDFESIPNQYFNPNSTDPSEWAKRSWYRFWLIDHPVQFVIGQRKRVVSIAVSPHGAGPLLSWHDRAKHEFVDEDVTKHFGPNEVLLHAWTREKEREYVTKLCKLIAPGDREARASDA